MSVVQRTVAMPACRDHTAVFQHPLLEDPPARSAPTGARRAYEDLVRRAREVCTACPVQVECLVTAVVRYDVAGFVAGTSARDRSRIRRALGWQLPPSDVDAAAGVRGAHQPASPDEVVRLRRAHPEESLERLAQRLGCSLSTVKRHLRSHRSAPQVVDRGGQAPSAEAVLAAAARSGHPCVTGSVLAA